MTLKQIAETDQLSVNDVSDVTVKQHAKLINMFEQKSQKNDFQTPRKTTAKWPQTKDQEYLTYRKHPVDEQSGVSK